MTENPHIDAVDQSASNQMNYFGDSDYLKGLLALPDKEEAVQYLTRGNSRHNVGEMSYEDSLALVKHLYKLGAVEVVAVELTTNAGDTSTDHLIVTLPKDRGARRAILNGVVNIVALWGWIQPLILDSGIYWCGSTEVPHANHRGCWPADTWQAAQGGIVSLGNMSGQIGHLA